MPKLKLAGESALNLAAYEEAATLFQRAREILTGPEHAAQRVEVDILRAELESGRSSHAKAIEILKPALEEARTTGHELLQANVLGQLGRIAMWQRDADARDRYLGEAMTIARKANHKPTMVFTLPADPHSVPA